MAFTVPGSFAVGQQPTAAQMNALVTAITELQGVVADSGWQSITINSGFTGTQASARRIGDVVYLRGTIKQTSGAYPPGGVNIGTIPAGQAPTRTIRVITPGNASSTANFITALIATSGSISVYGNGANPPDTVYLDMLSYPVT